MPHTKPFSAYVVNNLYDNSFFENDLPVLLQATRPAAGSAAAFATAKALFTDHTLLQLNEEQLEDAVIKPFFALLGWHALPKENKTIQGKLIEPDWTLFASLGTKEAYLALSNEQRRDTMDGIIAFAEVKAADKVLDTKKVNPKENPYWQLVQYLSLTKLPLGFLTNGLEWWLVDNSKVIADKRYLRVNVAHIIADNNMAAFLCFYALFSCAAFVPERAEDISVFDDIRRLDMARREQSEEDLRRVIYGEGGAESLFEIIGRALFATAIAHHTQEMPAEKREEILSEILPEILKEVYETSLYFAFRLLFIAYFEDKNWDTLKEHAYFSDFSLRNIDTLLQTDSPSRFAGWDRIQRLFHIFDEGNYNLAMPLINGGLFDDTKTPLLTQYRVMDNATLQQIFTALFIFGPDTAPLRRDFKALSVTHLGSMYEGLLEFEFRIDDADLTYLVYDETTKAGGATVTTRHEGYYSTYDTAQISKNARTTVVTSRLFPQNTLYLVGSQNSRKASASFYTPASIALPLVRRAIDQQLASMPANMSVLDLRILDNACGSGHLLIESLHYLTEQALGRTESDPRLADTLRDEMQRIHTALDKACVPTALRPDECMVLKRILLKKVIYGVDVQIFAIELAHLSLWIETFVFGTPLSLIEHHVKAGDALIGTTLKDFENALGKEGRQLNILDMTIKEQFHALYKVYTQLSALQDTTAQDIAASKKLFTQDICPTLANLNLLLDLCNYRDMLLAEGKADEAGKVRLWEQAPALLKGELPELKAALEVYRAKYRFFNWDVEFAEAFPPHNGNGNSNGNGPIPGQVQYGFHIIIGNPPWDKTKFEDPLFFSQYRSQYRNYTESKKQKTREDLLTNRNIRARYTAQQSRIQATNEYYKRFYPLNKGAGDGNLFRFFVERNLALLLPHASLNYILPTGLLTEDGSTTLRKAIFEKYTLTIFDGMENRKKIFPDVHSRYKFGLLQIVNAHNPHQTARTRFMLTDPAILSTSDGVFEYSLDDIRATSPEHMAYMEVAHGRDDLALISRIYQQFRPLDPAWSDFRAELHATNDKGLFLEEKPAWIDFRRELDATNDKSIFLEHKKDGLLPLYKGATIWQYNSRFAQPEYWLNADAFDEYLCNKEISRLISDVYPFVPKLASDTNVKAVLRAVGLHRREDLGKFVLPDRRCFRLGFRDIARDTDERTLICALLPKNIGAQNKLIMSIPKRYIYCPDTKTIHTQEMPIERLLFIQALFNSIPADWMLRFSVAITVNKTYLMRQPMPQPTDAELTANPVYKEIVLNSLKLSLHYNRGGFAELQKRFDIPTQSLPSTAKQVDMFKIRNDVLVAGLYGITKAEMAHILKSFNVLANKKPGYALALVEAMERATLF